VTTEADLIPASHQGIGKWLVLVLVVLLLAAVATWWALGLRTDMASGFSETRLSFTFEDTTLEDAVALLRPGVPLRLEGQTSFVITLKAKEMQEQHAFFWIAQLIDQQIVLRDGVITVRDVPWLERSYRWTARWAWDVLGIRVWPNR
jgi:hypothetical protein